MKTLFLLHGFGVASRVWEPVSYQLSNRYEVLIPDLPGHGETVVPFSGIRDAASRLEYVINEAKLSKLNVVGWSMGGQVALELCKLAADKIDSLILLSSTPAFTSENFEFGYNLAVFNKFQKGIKKDHEKAMRGFYKLLFSKHEDPSPYLDLLEGQMPSKRTLLSCMKAMRDEDQREVLPEISCPVLILSGSDDKICSPQASNFMAGAIRGSKLKVFKDAGHALLLTRKKELIDAIKNFVG